MFRDPVVTPCGNTYEREALEAVIKTSQREPQTQKDLKLTDLVPNHLVLRLVTQYKDELLLQRRMLAAALVVKPPEQSVETTCRKGHVLALVQMLDRYGHVSALVEPVCLELHRIAVLPAFEDVLGAFCNALDALLGVLKLCAAKHEQPSAVSAVSAVSACELISNRRVVPAACMALRSILRNALLRKRFCRTGMHVVLDLLAHNMCLLKSLDAQDAKDAKDAKDAATEQQPQRIRDALHVTLEKILAVLRTAALECAVSAALGAEDILSKLLDCIKQLQANYHSCNGLSSRSHACVMEQALALLCNMTGRNDDLCLTLCAAGGVDLIVQVIRQHGQQHGKLHSKQLDAKAMDVVKVAFVVLSNITFQNSSSSAQLGTSDTIELLTSTVKLFSASDKYLRDAFSVLCNVVNSGAACKLLASNMTDFVILVIKSSDVKHSTLQEAILLLRLFVQHSTSESSTSESSTSESSSLSSKLEQAGMVDYLVELLAHKLPRSAHVGLLVQIVAALNVLASLECMPFMAKQAARGLGAVKAVTELLALQATTPEAPEASEASETPGPLPPALQDARALCAEACKFKARCAAISALPPTRKRPAETSRTADASRCKPDAEQ